ncbi:GNAT family N-acetyltransferase [Curtobacterium sp. MCPF17_052]|uniref:GNAT family N-acetyltransferase n=1 Tax=Curtobacterium sp. MCPF17_052 TaxID=2175655 RepID=UPI0024DFBE4B|nr:GNAT family N-acetyltransferase [Curtobacterium sp. MCPF17_052]WIB11599.1 GNAT family N-acetyltransferase [Curtobacterium sp. MCPF17_052]
MITIERVPWEDPRGVALRATMDEEMHERYGDSNPGEAPEVTAERNRVLSVDPSTVVTSLLAVDEDGTVLGHIAVRRLGDEIELKRLIVLAAARGKGAATALLDECARVGREQGGHASGPADRRQAARGRGAVREDRVGPHRRVRALRRDDALVVLLREGDLTRSLGVPPAMNCTLREGVQVSPGDHR